MITRREYMDISEEESTRFMERSACDWEIIRNNSFGTHDRVWSTNTDYISESKMVLQKGTTVRINIKDTDYSDAVIAEFHNKVGKIVEVFPALACRVSLYTVELPNLRRCDFAENDLIARP